MTLFEKDKEIGECFSRLICYELSQKVMFLHLPGGQFNMAKLIPGKEEFYETLRYFGKQLEINKVGLFSLTINNF